MNPDGTPHLAGTLRVFFFLAMALTTVALVTSAVFSFYEPPNGDGEFEFEDEGAQEQADYNRNVGLILGLIGTPVIAAAILALGSRFNHLRLGLLGGGVALVLTGVGLGFNGSDDWLTFLVSGLAFLTLLGCAYWIEDGLPIGQAPPASGGGPDQPLRQL